MSKVSPGGVSRTGLCALVLVSALAWLATGFVAKTATAGTEARSEADAEVDRASVGTIGFTGHNVFGDAPGEFHRWRVLERKLDPAEPGTLEAVVEVDLASVDTGNADRDEHLRTPDFFDVAKHPIATVRGHSAKPLADSPEGHPRHALRFDVELHGVRKTLDGEIEIVESQPLVVEGGFTLLRTDFGIGEKPSRWNPLSIDDAVPVRFRIRFD